METLSLMKLSRPLLSKYILYPQTPRTCCQCLFTYHRLIRHSSTIPNDPSNQPSRPTLSQKTAEYLDNLQLRALAATQRINDITGYSSIESLKSQIYSQGSLQKNLGDCRGEGKGSTGGSAKGKRSI